MNGTEPIDPKRTAFVAIDLQKWIVSRDTKPSPSADVVARSARIADRLRDLGGLVVCVRVSFSRDGGDRLRQSTDLQAPVQTPPDGYDEIVPELGAGRERTIVVDKRQWGAFYGTDLDMQLRRRGVDTILLGGISTNIGVESTARSAYEHGYQLYFVADAMSCMSAEEHDHTLRHIFPRIGHVIASTDEMLDRLGPG